MRYAMQSNLAMSSVSSALRNLALEVIRISNDLRLLSSGPNTGLGEITLPALQPGSSIMPGKINPVIPELAAMVSFQVVGYDAAVALAVQAGQLELNVMMPTMAYSVLTSVTIMANMLGQLTEYCVKGITVNRATHRLLRAKHGVAGDRAESLHRVCEGGRDCEGVGEDGQVDHRYRPLAWGSDRRADQGDSRSGAYDRADVAAGRGQRARED